MLILSLRLSTKGCLNDRTPLWFEQSDVHAEWPYWLLCETALVFELTKNVMNLCMLCASFGDAVLNLHLLRSMLLFLLLDFLELSTSILQLGHFLSMGRTTGVLDSGPFSSYLFFQLGHCCFRLCDILLDAPLLGLLVAHFLQIRIEDALDLGVVVL
ncbi:hypothetical protein KCV07_g312, partial [Aureobasidium melanogenum]